MSNITDEQVRVALVMGRCISELRNLIEIQSDLEFDEITVAALQTAIESMELRKAAPLIAPGGGGEADRIRKALDYLHPHLDDIGAPTWAIQIASMLTGGDGCGYRPATARAGVDWSALRDAVEAVVPFVAHSDCCGDHDAYNNAEVPTCGCGMESARDRLLDIIDANKQESGHEQ